MSKAALSTGVIPRWRGFEVTSNRVVYECGPEAKGFNFEPSRVHTMMSVVKQPKERDKRTPLLCAADKEQCLWVHVACGSLCLAEGYDARHVFSLAKWQIPERSAVPRWSTAQAEKAIRSQTGHEQRP